MVLVYVELLDEPVYSFEKPFLTQVKHHLPGITALDIDSFSEDFLIAQAGQLVEQADACAVYFTSSRPETPLGATIRLAESLIRRPTPGLVILQGPHPRIERLFADRPNLIFRHNPDGPALLALLADYFKSC